MSFVNKPGRTSSRRKMVARQQVSDVFSYGYIVTTKSKGKYTQSLLEKCVTVSKSGTLEARRFVASILLSTQKYNKKDLVKKVFDEIVNRYKDTPGGYSRLLKTSDEGKVILSLV